MQTPSAYPKPPLIGSATDRGRAMQRAAIRERGHRAALSKLPGYRAARLTRAYSVDEVRQGRGMTADRLRQIASNPNVTKVPVLVRHSMHMPPAGRTLEAEFDPDSQFFHHRMQLNLGDGSTGDYVEAEQRKGNLLYTSAKFTVPEPDDPHPELFQSELIEVSFVDEPHEPHAEILVAHSTTDSQRPVRVLNLCSRIIESATAAKMSSAPTPAEQGQPQQQQQQPQAQTQEKNSNTPAPKQQPKIGGLTGEEVMRLIEEKKRLEKEREEWQERQKQLEYFQSRHNESLKPKMEAVSQFIDNDQQLNDDERAVVRAFVEEASADYRTAPALNWAHRLIDENTKLQAKLKHYEEEQDADRATSEELETQLRQALSSPTGSFSAGMTPGQARSMAGSQMPAVNTPLVAAHSAGGAPQRESGKPTRLSSKMYERICSYRHQYQGGLPPAKRQATDNV